MSPYVVEFHAAYKPAFNDTSNMRHPSLDESAIFYRAKLNYQSGIDHDST